MGINKIFHFRKECNYFCTQDIGVIFRVCLWKCSPLVAFHSIILKSNFIGQFSLTEVKWNIEIVLQKNQERYILLPFNFGDSHTSFYWSKSQEQFDGPWWEKYSGNNGTIKKVTKLHFISNSYARYLESNLYCKPLVSDSKLYRHQLCRKLPWHIWV